VTTIINVTEIL